MVRYSRTVHPRWDRDQMSGRPNRKLEDEGISMAGTGVKFCGGDHGREHGRVGRQLHQQLSSIPVVIRII